MKNKENKENLKTYENTKALLRNQEGFLQGLKHLKGYP